MLRLYNTLTRKKEEFKPLKRKRVNLFVCGPTVYDLSHIGHARTYVAFDMIVKYLRLKGYDTFYLQNITDVDDKIIDRAKFLSTAPVHLAELEEAEYYADMKSLRIDSVSKYARASGYVKEIIKQIKILVEKGFAYAVGGNVYFEVARFSDYGKLSHQRLEELKTAVRIEQDPNKKNGLDFVIWKAKKPGEIFWHSPWGEGRPGWHIEDTAITEKHFGPQYDIHGAAGELVFPHHESEIALMESVSGKKPLVKYWLHTGHLTVKGKKMSKSLRNFITIRTFLNSYPPEALRFLILSTHYRSPIDYNEKIAKQASRAIERINEFATKLVEVSGVERRAKGSGNNAGKNVEDIVKKTKEQLTAYMDDDFNSSKALAVVFGLIRKGNMLFGQNRIDGRGAKTLLSFFEEMDGIFGILYEENAIPKEKKGEEKEAMERIKRLVELREKHRKERDWKKADELREVLRLEGFWVDDTPRGPRLKKIKPK